MAKRVKKVTAVDDSELRRWCIEQATRWPTISPPHYAAQGGALGYSQPTEVDLIGRAKRLLDWVSGKPQ